MISRLGVYGGMFDPVHNGHIKAACYARDLLELEQVKLIPCKQPNHRSDAVASPEHRVTMLRLAIKDLPGLEIDTCELDRAGVSYAVDTLEYFHSQGIAEQIVFVLGMDSFNTLTSWHRWEAVQNLCHLLVLPRANEMLDEELADKLQLPTRMVDQPQKLFRQRSGCVYFDSEFSNTASSSQVRHTIDAHDDLTTLLDRQVFDFIVENELYGYSSRDHFQ